MIIIVINVSMIKFFECVQYNHDYIGPASTLYIIESKW